MEESSHYYCKQCSEELTGEDFGDFCFSPQLLEKRAYSITCDGCGPTHVNSLGYCISPTCKRHARKEEVEVRPAFYWCCSKCEANHLVIPEPPPDMTEEEAIDYKAELGIQPWDQDEDCHLFSIPDTLICSKCGFVFATSGDYIVDLDEDSDSDSEGESADGNGTD